MCRFFIPFIGRASNAGARAFCSFGRNEMNLTRSSRKLAPRTRRLLLSLLGGICFHLPSFLIHSAGSPMPCQDPNYSIPPERLTHTIITDAHLRQKQFLRATLSLRTVRPSTPLRFWVEDIVVMEIRLSCGSQGCLWVRCICIDLAPQLQNRPELPICIKNTELKCIRNL